MAGRVVVAGGSGFIGKPLVRHLQDSGYEPVVLSRSAKRVGEVKWDGKSLGPWVQSLAGAVAVINLSGASIAKRWTPEYKQEILRSRVDSTLVIGQAIAES